MKKNTTTTIETLSKSFWGHGLTRKRMRKEDEAIKRRAIEAHAQRQQHEMAEQAELRRQAEEQGLHFDPYYKLIRCQVCGEIKIATWKDGWCSKCLDL